MSVNNEIKSILKDEISRATEMSTLYGQMVIRYGFLLNGGALLAIPAFLEVTILKAGGLTVWSVGPFVVGLFLAVLAASLAHLQALLLAVKLQKIQLSELGIAPAVKPIGPLQKSLFGLVYIVAVSTHAFFAIGAVQLIFEVSRGAAP